MKPSDLFLDLQDLFGKLIPGFVIIANIYLLLQQPENLLNVTELNENNSVLLYTIIFICSYFIGDLNAYYSFRLRYYFHEGNKNIPTVLEFLKERDLSKKLIPFYESFFTEGQLEQNYRSLHYFCKKVTVESLPLSLNKVKKIEAAIHFKLCMLSPVLLCSLNLFLNKYYLFGSILFLTAPFLYYTAIQLTKQETHLIYINFYQHHHK